MKLNPRYWYIDENGKLKKYVYCGMCLSGPFKQTDENALFHRINKASYCIKCMKTLSIKDDLFVFKGSLTKEEMV
jgi:hypothetical protein